MRRKIDNTKKDIINEAKKIVGISPITDDDLQYISSKGTPRDNF